MSGIDWRSLYQEGFIEFEFNDAKFKIEPFENTDGLDIIVAYKTYGLSVNELDKVIIIRRGKKE